MESLEEDLTCSVCYSLFDDPRVLPCSHTFCKSCLDNVLQVSTNFSIWRPLRLPLKCPNCRSMVELPPTGVEALPINVSLRAIIEKYQRDVQPHAPLCPEHPRQPLNVYCVQDCKLICGLCLTVGQHQGHTIDDLQTAYVKARNTPEKLVERLTDKHWEDVCRLVEELEEEKSQYESLIRRDQDAVALFFRDLESLLLRKKDAFMKVLDKANEQVASTYKPLIEKLKDMKEEQLELVSLISCISEEESALVFLEKMHQLTERVDALTRTELPEVPSLHISPHVDEFLTQHWTNVTIGRLEHGPVPEISCQVKRHTTKEPASKSGQRWKCRPLMFGAFLMLLLSLVLLWFDSIDKVSLGLPFLSQICQELSDLAGTLSKSISIPGLGTSLDCLAYDLSQKFCSYVSALRESTYEHVTFFFNALQLC